MWDDRLKQISKRWRGLKEQERKPFLNRARENRSSLKKTQQVSVTMLIIIDFLVR